MDVLNVWGIVIVFFQIQSKDCHIVKRAIPRIGVNGHENLVLVQEWREWVKEGKDLYHKQCYRPKACRKCKNDVFGGAVAVDGQSGLRYG